MTIKYHTSSQSFSVHLINCQRNVKLYTKLCPNNIVCIVTLAKRLLIILFFLLIAFFFHNQQYIKVKTNNFCLFRVSLLGQVCCKDLIVFFFSLKKINTPKIVYIANLINGLKVSGPRRLPIVGTMSKVVKGFKGFLR